MKHSQMSHPVESVARPCGQSRGQASGRQATRMEETQGDIEKQNMKYSTFTVTDKKKEKVTSNE